MTELTLQGPTSIKGLAKVQGVGDRLLGHSSKELEQGAAPPGRRSGPYALPPAHPSRQIFAGWGIWAPYITVWRVASFGFL